MAERAAEGEVVEGQRVEGAGALGDGGSRPPNILFILADDLGQETLGCYGGTSYATPEIDALARGGTRFRHAYSLPVCHPTRVAFLTGQYPFRLDQPSWGTFPSSAEERTLAQVLRSAGYATAVAGKWQLALLRDDPDHPARLGFDEHCLFGWHEGPRYYRPFIRQNGEVRDDVEDRYGPDVYCEFLIDFMGRHRDRPFFAFYSMALCHDVTDDLDEPVPFGPRGRYDSYGEMVELMDERVGRILRALDDLGLRDRTLVVFTGDNGTPKRSILTVEDGKLVRAQVVSERDGEEVRGGKGELTDAGTRVPLIASWPRRVPAGKVSDQLVDFSDFLPTFAELAGAQAPQDVVIDGRSFASHLLGRGPGERDWAFAEQRGRAWVRTQRWKLYSDGRLYDMEGDPEEAQPISPAGGSRALSRTRSRLTTAFEELGWSIAAASGRTAPEGASSVAAGAIASPASPAAVALSALPLAPLQDEGRRLRIIAFGAHPDDCEIKAGGTAALWAEQGHRVKFVSVTNGDIGHWRAAGGPLARRRLEEVREAAEKLGVTTEVLDNHDGELLPTIENRRELVRLIREWRADVVLGPRPNDYHPDHRYTGVLVQDAAYMVTVPHFLPLTPHLEKNPVFLYYSDRFDRPNPFRPDVVVPIDKVIEPKLDALVGMTSQFVEGGANGGKHLLPENDKEALARRRAVRQRFSERFARTANTYRRRLVELYGEEAGNSVHFAEAFELCEYGRQPEAKELRSLFPVPETAAAAKEEARR